MSTYTPQPGDRVSRRWVQGPNGVLREQLIIYRPRITPGPYEPELYPRNHEPQPQPRPQPGPRAQFRTVRPWELPWWFWLCVVVGTVGTPFLIDACDPAIDTPPAMRQ